MLLRKITCVPGALSVAAESDSDPKVAMRMPQMQRLVACALYRADGASIDKLDSSTTCL